MSELKSVFTEESHLEMNLTNDSCDGKCENEEEGEFPPSYAFVVTPFEEEDDDREHENNYGRNSTNDNSIDSDSNEGSSESRPALPVRVLSMPELPLYSSSPISSTNQIQVPSGTSETLSEQKPNAMSTVRNHLIAQSTPDLQALMVDKKEAIHPSSLSIPVAISPAKETSSTSEHHSGTKTPKKAEINRSISTDFQNYASSSKATKKSQTEHSSRSTHCTPTSPTRNHHKPYRQESFMRTLIRDVTGKEKLREELSDKKADLGPIDLSKDSKVYVKVVEAKGLPGKKSRKQKERSNANFMKLFAEGVMGVASPNLMVVEKVSADCYATVSVDHQRVRTRTIFQRFNPFWCEEFTLDVESFPTSVVKIYVWDSDKYEGDEAIGKLCIPISSLKDQQEHEQWFPLFPAKSKAVLNEAQVNGGVKFMQTEKTYRNEGLGTIRLKIKYTEEVILSLEEYRKLIELLCEDEKFTIIKLLGKITSERETVASILVKIFQARGQVISFLREMTAYEIQSTSNPDIIFRGNSLVTKALDVYMKFVGMPYLHTTLKHIIKEICIRKPICEIDPSKLEKPEAVNKNTKRLLKWINQFASAIFGSLANCPPEFHEVFSHVQKSVKESYPEEQVKITKYTAVSGFIFLRFFCPAILGPKLFGLMEEHPDVKTTRTLILIAKALQNLANLVEFSASKEEYMGNLNGFVVSNMEVMKQFLDKLATPSDSVSKGPTPVANVRLEKELASIYRHLKKNKEALANCLSNETERGFYEKLCLSLDELQELESKKKDNLSNKI